MTKAERYKRNYRLIKNKFHDTKLAKKYQSYSDDQIYSQLGIKVANKKTPELKTATKSQVSRSRRLLLKYQYARSQGLDPDEANKVTKYKDSKISSTAEYITTKNKKTNVVYT